MGTSDHRGLRRRRMWWQDYSRRAEAAGVCREQKLYERHEIAKADGMTAMHSRPTELACFVLSDTQMSRSLGARRARTGPISSRSIRVESRWLFSVSGERTRWVPT